MLKIGLGSDEAPLYFIILQRRSYLRLCKFNGSSRKHGAWIL